MWIPQIFCIWSWFCLKSADTNDSIFRFMNAQCFHVVWKDDDIECLVFQLLKLFRKVQIRCFMIIFFPFPLIISTKVIKQTSTHSYCQWMYYALKLKCNRLFSQNGIIIWFLVENAFKTHSFNPVFLYICHFIGGK